MFVFIVLFVGFLFLMIREQSAAAVLTITLIGCTFGSLLAFFVGAVVGLLYGLVDTVLLGLSGWLFQWVAAADGSSAGGA